MSVMVATPEGLVTPLLRNAEAMGFLDIEKESRNSARRRVAIEDIAGGSSPCSFSFLFLLGYMLVGLTPSMTPRMVAPSGGLSGMSIINLPQAAVLGMHEIKVSLSLSTDGLNSPNYGRCVGIRHQEMDGRKAATLFGE